MDEATVLSMTSPLKVGEPKAKLDVSWGPLCQELSVAGSPNE